MGDFAFSLTPPAGWDAECCATNVVFGSPGWQAMLESSFGCRSIYAWDGMQGAAISVFRAGPFSVGYVGFPAGSVFGDAPDLEALVA
jgi:hypothetical protein